MLKKVKITQLKSSIGRLPKHKAILRSLGLKKIRHTVICNNTPSIQGMLRKISYMIQVHKD